MISVALPQHGLYELEGLLEAPKSHHEGMRVDRYQLRKVGNAGKHNTQRTLRR